MSLEKTKLRIRKKFYKIISKTIKISAIPKSLTEK